MRRLSWPEYPMPRLPFWVFREGALVPRPRLLRKWNAGVFGLSRVYRTFNPYPPAFLWTHWALPTICVSLAGRRRPLREAHRTPPSARAAARRPTPPRAARTVQTTAAASRGPRRSSPAEQWMRGQQGRLSRRKGYPRRLRTRLNRCWAAPVRVRRQDPDFSASDGRPASQPGGRLVHACRTKPSAYAGSPLRGAVRICTGRAVGQCPSPSPTCPVRAAPTYGYL